MIDTTLLEAAERVRATVESEQTHRPPPGRAHLVRKLARTERLISEGHSHLAGARDALVQQLEREMT